MKSVTFNISDEDWSFLSALIGEGGKYVSITDCMTDAVRTLIREREQRMARNAIPKVVETSQ